MGVDELQEKSPRHENGTISYHSREASSLGRMLSLSSHLEASATENICLIYLAPKSYCM